MTANELKLFLDIHSATRWLTVYGKELIWIVRFTAIICSVHLILFVVKWITDARTQRKANRAQQHTKIKSQTTEKKKCKQKRSIEGTGQTIS